MNEEDVLRTRSTSAVTADVTDVVLRSGERRRLVFRATLVRNQNDPAASVRGTLVYQAKRDREQWVDIDGLNLTSMKAGEWTKIELRSAEVLALFQAIQSLYTVMRDRGIVYGEQEFVPVAVDQTIRQILGLLDSESGRDLLEMFMSWARDQGVASLAASLQAADRASLTNFNAALTVARLRQFVQEARTQLQSTDEGLWQRLLTRENWVISQVYAQPLVIIREQAYLGGKSIDNAGGSVVDYLYANHLTNNAFLVEIKTPGAGLLQPYRGNVMRPTADLGGGVQQLLQARHSFQEQFRQLVARSSAILEVVSPRCLLIVGCEETLTTDVARRSFELFRNNTREVEVVTFDELLEKADQLIRLLETDDRRRDESETRHDLR